jgi:putative hemolysin
MNTSSSKKPFVPASLVLALVAFPACGSSDDPIRGDCPDCMPTISTVSSYCSEQGGSVDIRTDAAAQYGVCKFNDGSECEVWAFYRGECKPGDCASWETCKPGVDGGAASDSGTDSGAAFDKLTLSSSGGMPGPRRDGDECDNMYTNVRTVTASPAEISWDLCEWPTGDVQHMVISKGSRSLAPAELATVKESLQQVHIGNSGYCGADKPIVTLDVEAKDSVGHYVDDFYGCNPPPQGRTFVTGIDWVESAVGKLVQ